VTEAFINGTQPQIIELVDEGELPPAP
jgi:hypothetical protein